MLGAVGVIAIIWDIQQSVKEPNWLTNSSCLLLICVIQHDKTVMRYNFNRFNEKYIFIYLRFTLLFCVVSLENWLIF